MPNILQVAVPNGSAAVVWNGRPAQGISSLLLINQDLNNIVYIGNDPTITATAGARIPIAPNGSLSVDPSSAWYVVGAAAGIQPLVMVPNGQSFFLGLTQGLGQLAIPSVRSPNYVTGVSGWTINKDGSAEFNNITIRGPVVVQGTNGGLYVYTGTPAFGNPPIYWISNGSLKDPFGNVLIALQGSIENIGGTWQAFSTSNGFLQWWYSTVGPSGPWTNGASIVQGNTINGDLAIDSNPGTVSQVTELYLGSAQSNWWCPAVIGNLSGVQFNPGTGIGALMGGTLLETWHTLTISGTGLTAGTPAPKYKLYPDNTVSIQGEVNATSGTTSGTFATLPVGYRPISTKKYAVPVSAGTPPTGANPQITIGTTGTVQLSAGPTAAAYSFSLDVARFPLDY